MNYVLKKLDDTISVTGIANVHFFEFPQNFYTQDDSHPFYELVYVSSGSLMVVSEDYTGTLDKNKLIIHRAGEHHFLRCSSGNEPTVIIIGFTCTGGNIDKFSSSPVHLDDVEIKKLAEIVKEGRNVFAPPYDVPKYDMKKKKNPPFGAEQMLKNLLEYFLIGLFRKIDTPIEEDAGALSRLTANEIVAYIDDNYKERITLDELAFLFRTNRSTLCKVFKNSTGKTVSEYVGDKKLEAAKRKITQTDKTLTEIAEELNFESIHYFTRFFKK
ncbi:MAG: helix-turn-helix transcriptional regulator, partial [Clostridia bacterium]|nr:helix-turn-helix transcriptional regulator [Clostridia bacterium]